MTSARDGDNEVTDDQLAAADVRARAVVERVVWTMGLEGQRLTAEAIEELVREALGDEIADI